MTHLTYASAIKLLATDKIQLRNMCEGRCAHAERVSYTPSIVKYRFPDNSVMDLNVMTGECTVSVGTIDEAEALAAELG